MVTMTKTEALLAIAKVRRDLSRNAQVMALCDAFEAVLVKPNGKLPLTRAEIQRNYRQRVKERNENRA